MTDPLRARLTALEREMRSYLGPSWPPNLQSGERVKIWADQLAALLHEPSEAVPLLTRADVEALWSATVDRDDWTHIVTFANAVRALDTARAGAPEGK